MNSDFEAVKFSSAMQIIKLLILHLHHAIIPSHISASESQNGVYEFTHTTQTKETHAILVVTPRRYSKKRLPRVYKKLMVLNGFANFLYL